MLRLMFVVAVLGVFGAALAGCKAEGELKTQSEMGLVK